MFVRSQSELWCEIRALTERPVPRNLQHTRCDDVRVSVTPSQDDVLDDLLSPDLATFLLENGVGLRIRGVDRHAPAFRTDLSG